MYKICIDVYADVIYKINAFILLTDICDKYVYKLYEDFSSYNYFEKKVKNYNFTNEDEEYNKKLNNLFNFNHYHISFLLAELKRLSKSDLYLRGILSKDEYKDLISNYANDTYFSDATHIINIKEFTLQNKDELILFLRKTIYICSQVIFCFPSLISVAKEKEKMIKQRIDELYFDEVYPQTEEYERRETEEYEARAKYFAENPEEFERIEKEFEESYNETKEDKFLRELFNCFYGLSSYDLDKILNNLDTQSPKIEQFLSQPKVQKKLKSNRRLRKKIERKFGNIKGYTK